MASTAATTSAKSYLRPATWCSASATFTWEHRAPYRSIRAIVSDVEIDPARTFTAEGTVGNRRRLHVHLRHNLYQLIGGTLPISNKFFKNPVFAPEEPWLLKFFDRVRFYPIDEACPRRTTLAFGQQTQCAWLYNNGHEIRRDTFASQPYFSGVTDLRP